jgi:hypothetical protein
MAQNNFRNRSLMIRATILIFSALASASAQAAECPLETATTNQGDIFVPPFTLHMLPPSPPDLHPDSWDSAVPMSITGTVSKPCTVSSEVGIVTTPIILAGHRYVYVPTYSGSESRLFVIDAATCGIMWRSPIVDAAKITATTHGYNLPGHPPLIIAPNCLPEKP